MFISKDVYIPEIESLEDYYRELYYFVYENWSPVMVFKRNYLSKNRFVFFTQTIHSGVVRTYTVKIDSIHDPRYKWIIERETCVFIIDDVEDFMLPALVALEKERYESLNLRLVSERKVLNNQALELMACRKNTNFNFHGYMVMFKQPDFKVYDYLFNYLEFTCGLHDEMSDVKDFQRNLPEHISRRFTWLATQLNQCKCPNHYNP